MGAALALARRGLGNVWPNPAVGCVLVMDGTVVGRGWTQQGGRPHAETEALARAGSAARGATAYVTLEPCSHHGKTPPCAEALIGARVARVVVACRDPDPRVDGRGLAALRSAGIDIVEGVSRAQAEALNAGFFLRLRENRPFVTLKLAGSLDMRLATAGGESKWITGEAARARAHRLRAEHDAVLVGSGTALADDPALDARLSGLGDPRRVRVVADGRLRTPLSAKLVATARTQPTWILTRGDSPALTASGVELVRPETMEPRDMLAALAARGITRVLIEGGGALAASFLRAGLADRLAIFRAGIAIGGDGLPALAGLGVAALAGAPRYRLESVERVGDDTLEFRARA
ncbi:MAG: bifunctional diaminohydroxyphosphoribosylaminopyrimidine deaminase/5-amino-6-(5-phosphoribosylamino)uracil reductase RibD [Tagaea sp.]|nr:bifunctional diaminohydroxyphosphoribosylaminopyrimidine deaminase/5-amino-6-(5-phosphoribosylamino)uracil reductase RibD [Tagaea sp.]